VFKSRRYTCKMFANNIFEMIKTQITGIKRKRVADNEYKKNKKRRLETLNNIDTNIEQIKLKKEKIEGNNNNTKKNAEGEKLWKILNNLDPSCKKEYYFNKATGEWDLDGINEDLTLEQAEGEKLFDKLVQLDPSCKREHYFNENTYQWDIEGLNEDLSLEQQEGEKLFVQLVELDPTCEREHYFDGNEWDLHGLKEDLTLANNEKDGIVLFTILKKLDDEVEKEDYLIENQWDITGIKDDINLARKERITNFVKKSKAEPFLMRSLFDHIENSEEGRKLMDDFFDKRSKRQRPSQIDLNSDLSEYTEEEVFASRGIIPN